MKIIKIFALSSVVLALAGCQTKPVQFNGVTGYQIEQKDAKSATLAYTLAGRADRKLDESKLQRACKKVLDQTQTYKLTVLSVNEIANPAAMPTEKPGVQLGHSRTSFSLSDTPNMNNSGGYAARDALDTRPSTLHVVRYTCTQ
ncbi:hypothetical protein EC844_102252 [Acinetobacter calcoaceticus]|uniref:Uncharacterized protein n=1 Tax=Acinetobacter calcoaceticus TaxID=471 RepID=A0A4R1Y0G3_ACICA|nr:hypothetical protein EC844_102252 [Acinetobacter calcoaceticus]